MSRNWSNEVVHKLLASTVWAILLLWVLLTSKLKPLG